VQQQRTPCQKKATGGKERQEQPASKEGPRLTCEGEARERAVQCGGQAEAERGVQVFLLTAPCTGTTYRSPQVGRRVVRTSHTWHSSSHPKRAQPPRGRKNSWHQ